MQERLHALKAARKHVDEIDYRFSEMSLTRLTWLKTVAAMLLVFHRIWCQFHFTFQILTEKLFNVITINLMSLLMATYLMHLHFLSGHYPISVSVLITLRGH